MVMGGVRPSENFCVRCASPESAIFFSTRCERARTVNPLPTHLTFKVKFVYSTIP